MASVLSFFLNDLIVPGCLNSSKSLITVVVCDRQRSESPSQVYSLGTTSSGGPESIVFISTKPGLQYAQSIILQLSDPNFYKIIWSPDTRWKNSSWDLSGGYGYLLTRNGDVHSREQFSQLHFPLVEAEKAKRQIDKAVPESRDLTKNLTVVRESLQAGCAASKLKLELFRRFSEPAACFFLMIAVLPWTLLGGRRDKGFDKSFITATIILIAYFVMLDGGRVLAETGKLAPMFAAYGPHWILLSISIAGLFMHRRESFG